MNRHYGTLWHLSSFMLRAVYPNPLGVYQGRIAANGESYVEWPADQRAGHWPKPWSRRLGGRLGPVWQEDAQADALANKCHQYDSKHGWLQHG